MIDPARLYSALLNTGLQSRDNPLYQVIYQLIGLVVNLKSETTVGRPPSSVGGLKNLTYITTGNESTTLPNSRQLLAGTNITFDDSVSGRRTINSTGGVWAPLTDGDADETDLIFANGECIMVGTP